MQDYDDYAELTRTAAGKQTFRSTRYNIVFDHAPGFKAHQ